MLTIALELLSMQDEETVVSELLEIAPELLSMEVKSAELSITGSKYSTLLEDSCSESTALALSLSPQAEIRTADTSTKQKLRTVLPKKFFI
ncbi:hypothetical protein [Fibrobacter sp.]|uniref:hypothetical protein n=1 Tax=Fibrobacter sp. TaxID=35828 RepID=UPI00389073ED